MTKIVAVNLETKSKYTSCVCKGNVCRVKTKKSHGAFSVSKKNIKLVK